MVKAWRKVHRQGDPAAAYHRKVQASETGEGELAGVSQYTQLKMQKLAVHVSRAHLQWRKEKGELHDVAECDLHRVQAIMEVRNRLMEAARSEATGLAGLTSDRIEARLTEVLTAILEEFAAGGDDDGPAAGGNDE